MNPFGVTKLPAFGTFGEFNVGTSTHSLRAKYILTKMRPGIDGSWESSLASYMVPWREVFPVEQLSFDELLQRDLDDSRVAHDLIPYLLGDTGDGAKFFPPILAVIAPRRDTGIGINPAYPTPAQTGEFQQKQQFGDLFDFEQMYWKSPDNPTGPASATPLAKLDYNPQRAAFIIVDGQHRAMAILALHRQLNSRWGGSPYATYYDHIRVTAEQVKTIELPVCVIFFPDLHESSELLTQGANLVSVCRDIFLVVNRSAKPVTESRSVLLDDEDIPARLMRRTLSALKDRSMDDYNISRIYSISYGDSDADLGKQVIHGHLEYSSAIALHKIHAAISFGRMEAFGWNSTIDITDGRNTRNSSRPAEVLLGTDAQHLPTVSRRAGKTLTPADVKEVVIRLGNLADEAILKMFDNFRPFAIHNRTMRTLRDRLSDPHIQADPVQKKCLSLIFEGSGIRNVFDSHVDRLKTVRDERQEEGKPIEDRLATQITFCDAVTKALAMREVEVHKAKACAFFQIDQNSFYSNASPTDQAALEERSRRIFQTVSTQAFQLGLCMGVFTTVEELRRQNRTAQTPFLYDRRKELALFVTDAFIAGLNSYFSPDETSTHRTLTGFFKEPRASVLDQNASSMRGLFAMRGGELNERQWPFFRYLVLELVHSQYGWEAAVAAMGDAAGDWKVEWYKQTLPQLVDGILADREKYIEDAIITHLSDRQFRTLLEQRRYQERGAGTEEGEIDVLIADLEKARKEEARGITAAHLQASLGSVEEREVFLARLTEAWPA